MNPFQKSLSLLQFPNDISNVETSLVRMVLTLAATINPGTSGPFGPAVITYLRTKTPDPNDPAIARIERLLRDGRIITDQQ